MDEGTKGKGRGRKTWNECMKVDKRKLIWWRIMLKIEIDVGVLQLETIQLQPQCGIEGV